MAGFRVRIKASAAKEIEAIEPKEVRQRVVKKIEALGSEPRPPGCEKLSGTKNRYRIRQGMWRIVYSIEEGELVVVVVKVGHRREVYRRL